LRDGGNRTGGIEPEEERERQREREQIELYKSKKNKSRKIAIENKSKSTGRTKTKRTSDLANLRISSFLSELRSAADKSFGPAIP
jgi:hypothetical protein